VSDFVFNASALGMGGKFHHAGGSCTVISSLASVALAPTGGEGSAVVENYEKLLENDPKRRIAFARAESRVIGFETGRGGNEQYTTYADTFITGLSVFERFKVALMQVSMTSTRGLDPADSRFELKAVYRGVELDGEEIIPAIDLELCRPSNYHDFTNTLKRDLSRYAALLNVKDTELSQAIKNRRQPILGTIVNRIDRNDCALASGGNKLVLKELGSVRFGELLVKPGRRRVNLLRFEFGSEDASRRELVASNTALLPIGTGSMTMGSLDGNGVPVWPRV
jgi:hypothetical protein